MNTGSRTSLSAGLFLVMLVSALLLMPLASPAQSTFFGSGGSTNTAAYASNLAFGANALQANTTGSNITAIGLDALYSNTTGGDNTATGYVALFSNTTGSYNTAFGFEALYYNTTGYDNTANGYQALFSNYTGQDNTAAGLYALYSNVTGSYNTATGLAALANNTTGYENTASGDSSLRANTTGSFNIAFGYDAGSKLIAGSNNIDVGNSGAAKESGVIRIGTKGTHKSAYIAGIDGVTASKGVAVYINASGQLGTLTSSQRFKKDIKDMGPVSDKLMQLRPVTFRYKEAAEDGTHPIEYGLIAEEVAKVYPDLVQYDKAGKPFTIYYHLLTPMLLNELQKAHRRNVAQNAKIAALAAAQKAAQAETASLKDALKRQGSELAALKQSQQQQLAALAKLTSLVQASENKAPLQQAAYAQH